MQPSFFLCGHYEAIMKPFGEQASSPRNRQMAHAGEGMGAAWTPERGAAPASVRQQEVQAIFDASLDAMVVFDDNWRILEANPAACEFFGIPPDEMRRRTFDSLFAPAERERFRSEWAGFLRAGRRRGERE
ncbi:MAG: PAS domain-containing protein, partial [Candidatus Acidiferrales bacterium]